MHTRAELEGIRDVVARHGAPRRVRRDPRPAGAAGRRARALPVAGGHRRPRGRRGRGVQGVQHPRPQVRADADRRRRDPRPAGRDPDGPERLVGPARRRRADRGVQRGRRVAGRAASSGSTSSAPCSASCSPSTCPRPGCGRSRRRTWPGSTCVPTATTTPRRCSSAGASGCRPGEIYWPGRGHGHVRLNIATSPDRLTEIVRRMARRADRVALSGVRRSVRRRGCRPG